MAVSTPRSHPLVEYASVRNGVKVDDQVNVVASAILFSRNLPRLLCYKE
jgi:hypothetical protein